MRRRIAAVAVALVFGGTLFAAPAAADEVAVSIHDFSFDPSPVQVQAGDTVTWTNNDMGEPHTVTADDGSFSMVLNPGESASHTFTENGEVPYYCKLHGGPGGNGMSGVVQVGDVEPPATIQLSGSDNVARSIAWSNATYPDGAPFALIGRSDNFADSLSTGAVQGKLHAPLLLTGSSALDPRVKAELARLDPTVVYLFGGTAALAPAVADELTAAGYTVHRIAGTDRLGTATASAQTFFPEATEAILVRGFGDADPTRAFADSLAAGSLAASMGVPTLFSVTGSLSPTTKTYLQQHPIDAVHIIGGTGALSDQVETDVHGLGIEAVERHAGFSRYDTARIVSGGIDSQEAIVVDGTDPNAWADGFAAAGRGSRTYLTNGDALSGATAQDLSFGDESNGIVCGTTTSALACSRAEDARAMETDFPAIGGFLEFDPATHAGGASGLYAASDTDICYDVFGFQPEGELSIRRGVDDTVVTTLALEPSTDNDPFGCSYGLPAATVADLLANPGDYYLHLEQGAESVDGDYRNLSVLALAAILPEQEVPGPGDENAVGFGFVFTTDDPAELCMGMVIFGFGAAPTAAHIHEAASGSSGPVVATLATPDNGDFAESIGCYPVGEPLASDIAATPSDYYMNVHTSQFPNGAARGQLIGLS